MHALRAVAELVEFEGLRRLKARYVRLVDTKGWAELRGLLVDDFAFWRGLDGPPAYASAEEFVRGLRRNHAGSVTVHQAYLPELVLPGDGTASGVWAMTDRVDGAAGGVSFRGAGHYHETYRKGLDGQWRFVTMRLTRLRLDRSP